MAPLRAFRCAWALVLAALVLGGCSSREQLGGFEDDLGDDGGSTPDLPQSECDPRRYDGCDDGQKCGYVDDPVLGPLNRCVPLLGEGLAGEPCERIGESDSCANHHLCWGFDSQGQGTCVAYCSTSLQCTGEGLGEGESTCSVSNSGLLSLCLPVCDPLLQDCAEGQGCYADDYQRWACDQDQSGEGGAHGEPCACLNCCDPGLTCLPGGLVDAEGCGAGGAAGCCATVCMLDDGKPVEGVCETEAERCEPFYTEVLVMGYEDVGVCRL